MTAEVNAPATTTPGRVLVTGGAGFVGRRFCKRFLDRGDDVVCVDPIAADTGGIDPSLETGLAPHIRAQATLAMEEADVILFVIDGPEGPTSTDMDIAALLRRSGKPVIVVANKVDSDKREMASSTAWELGAGEVLHVSAAHGRSMGDLSDGGIAAISQLVDLLLDKETRVRPADDRES